MTGSSAVLTEDSKMQNMCNAVRDNEDLRQVNQKDDKTTNRSKALNYTEYLAELRGAAESYDAYAKNPVSKPGAPNAPRKVYVHEFGMVDESFVEAIEANAHSRINDKGQARMDFGSWKQLSPAVQTQWDSIPEEAKAIILNAAKNTPDTAVATKQVPGKSRPPRSNNRPQNQRANLHDMLESVQQSSDLLQAFATCFENVDEEIPDEALGQPRDIDTMSSDQFLLAYKAKLIEESQVNPRQVNFNLRDPHLENAIQSGPTLSRSAYSTTPPVAPAIDDRRTYVTKRELPPSSIRRMMSSSANSPAHGGSSNYKCNMHRFINDHDTTERPYIEVTTRTRSDRGALIDRGANGSVGGADVRVIAYVEGHLVDVGGLDGHRINDIPIAMVGAVMTDQTGEFIVIINQVAYTGKGRTILSSAQMESFGLIVHDRALKAGGRQCIESPNGFFVPLDVIDNLAYTPMRPYTNKEWENLPHRCITADKWTSNEFDFRLTEVPNWESTISTNNINPDTRPFDQYGNYKHRFVSMAKISEIDGDLFFDATQPNCTVNLHEMECTIDTLSTLHSVESQFHDNFQYLDTLDVTFSHNELLEIHNRSSSRTRRPTTRMLESSLALPSIQEASLHPDPTQEPLNPSTDNRTSSLHPRDARPSPRDYSSLRPFFGYQTTEVIKRTFEVTTQHARLPANSMLKQRFKSPFPALNIPRRSEDVAMDTIFSDTPAIGSGVKMAQFFCGRDTLLCDVYGMHSEKELPNTVEDNIRERGAPDRLLSDMAKSEMSTRILDLLRYYVVGSWYSAPYHQHQNPAERRYEQVKRVTNNIMDAYNSAVQSRKWRTPLFLATGRTNDISMPICFIWLQPGESLSNAALIED
jgi:hypothetical protein